MTRPFNKDVFGSSFDKLMEIEGGARVTNTAGDHGGVTKYGLSQRAHPDLDIANLSEADAKAVYAKQYWPDQLNCLSYSSPKIAYAIFDLMVNMGNKGAIRVMQHAINLNFPYRRPIVEDGIWGPLTDDLLTRCAESDSRAANLSFLPCLQFSALRRYVEIVANDSSQYKFLEGWKNRVDRYLSISVL